MSQARTPSLPLTLSAIYFSSFSALFAWSYLPRHFETIGLSGIAIGAIFSTRNLAQTLLTPVWAMLADRYNLGRLLLVAQAILGALAALALPLLESHNAIFAVVLLHAVTMGCSLPLVDAAALRQVGNEHFGRIRSWGSIGYGVCAMGAALWGAQHSHADLAAIAPWAIAGLTALAMFATLRMPASEPVEARPAAVGDIWGLLRRPMWLALLGVGALHWASIAPYNLLFVFLCEQREMGAWVPGLAIGAGIGAEVMILALSRHILARWRPVTLIIAALVATSVRWGLTAAATSIPAMIAAQSIHGLSFGAFYIAMMAIMSREIPQHLRTTGQSFFYFVVFGWGGGVGSLAAGAMFDHMSAAQVFGWAGALEAMVLVLAVAMWRRWTARWHAQQEPLPA